MSRAAVDALMRSVRRQPACPFTIAVVAGLLAGCAVGGASLGVVQPDASTEPPQPGIANTQDLLNHLRQTGEPVSLEIVEALSVCRAPLCGPDQVEHYDEPVPEGCTPMRCSVQLGPIEWVGDTQELRVIGGEQITVANAGTGPALDLAPFQDVAALVRSQGEVWGQCIEMLHEGLGQSGRFQRWTTLMIVPFEHGKPRTAASRLTGYWASCAALQVGGRPGDIEVPLIEPAGRAEDGLVLNRYRCDAEGCTLLPQARPQRMRVDEESVLRLID